MYEKTIRKLNDWEHARLVMCMRGPKPKQLSMWQRLSRSIWGEDGFAKSIEIGRQKMIPKWREAIDDGQVVVHHVRSSAMAMLLAWSDEASLCFFDIGNGQLFCMLSWDRFSESEEWGNTDFKYAHTLKHSLGDWIYCYGDELRPIPSRLIQSKEFIELPRSLPSVFVFDGKIDTFADDFRRYVQEISGNDDK